MFCNNILKDPVNIEIYFIQRHNRNNSTSDEDQYLGANMTIITVWCEVIKLWQFNGGGCFGILPFIKSFNLASAFVTHFGRMNLWVIFFDEDIVAMSYLRFDRRCLGRVSTFLCTNSA